MKVRRPLAGELAVLGGAVLGGAKPLEALLDDGRVLAVVVGVHLHVGGRYVDLVAVVVDAVVVGLLEVVGAGAHGVPLGAVVRLRVPHEAVLQRVVPLLVPLEVAYHLLLLDKDATAAVEAVEVLPAAELLAVGAPALLPARVAPHVSRVVDLRRLCTPDQALRHRGHALPQQR